jgi:hypothetical protein
MKPDWNAIAKVGLPGVIACFLVWKLADGFEVFDVRLKAIESQHAEMLTHSERIEDLMGRAYMGNERVLYVLRAMCVNDAKSQEARRLCLEESR